jgi:Protein kinase domain
LTMTGPETSEPSWRQVRAALEHALDLAPDERGAYLDRIGADQPRLAARLRELISNATSVRLNPQQPLASVSRELAVAPLPREGDRIGRFTVERLLGTGGMGVVYAARDPELNRTVAVKVIHAALVSAEYTRRFEREAHALARLRHPGIAQVYETGSLDGGQGAQGRSVGSPYIVMEFIPDARPLNAQGLTFVQLIERFQAVLTAVQHAHEHGVIHCDLKPANILLDRSDQPRLIDFGIARFGTHTDTVSGGTAGTLRYMSPERCGTDAGGPRGLGDTRTDVFALGVILYELLEGRSPYACIDGPPGTLMDAVRAGAIVPPQLRLAPADMRRDLRAILTQSLAVDPGHRYSSVGGLAEDLRRLLQHQPVAARPPSVLHELILMARRNRLAVTAALLVMAALGVGGVSATIGLVHARRAGAQAEAEVLRSKRVIRFLEATINSVVPDTAREAKPSPRAGVDPMTQWLHEGARFEQPRRTGEAARVADVLLQAAGRIGDQFADDPLLEAQLAIDLAQSLRAVGQHDVAVTLARRSWELRLKHLGPDHEDTLRAQVALALYANQDPGQIDMVRDALRGVESRFGRADPRWFQLRSFLVDTYAERVGTREAVADCDRAIEECAAEPGDHARELQELRYRRGYYLADVEGRADEGRAAAERALTEVALLDGGPTLINIQQRFGVAMLYLEHDPAHAEAILRYCIELAPSYEGPDTILCYEIRSRLYEALLRQHKLEPAEAVAREQLTHASAAMGDASYYTIKAKARVARVMTWAASLGEHKDLEEAEQLAREASVDGLKQDEKSPGGGYDAYFRGIWAQALILHGDPGSLIAADRLLQSTIDARAGAPILAWCDGYLALTLAQLRRAQGRPAESDAAFERAGQLLDQLKDRTNPMLLSLADARRGG